MLWSVIGPPLASNVTCPAFTTQAGCNVLTVALLKVQRNVGCSELDSKRRQKLFTPSLRSLFLSTLWAFRLGTGWALDCRVQPRQTYAVAEPAPLCDAEQALAEVSSLLGVYVS